jgi:hypothetical protein
MKRNSLLIAIAVIAVVGIAVGLFLSGAGQNGQLPGALMPKPTTLTLSYTVGMEDGMGGYELFLNGRLADSTGAPVTNRAVRLTFTVPGETVINDAGTATTGADGSYSLRIQQYYWYYGKHPVYTARFAGDSAYLASQSSGVAGP